ncbi:MAG: DUF4783 domain-containing protein [Bacteroidales bacterium]|nr:DUF4783 domain-containing protein [Bacteroidales bacterium]MDD4209174.1 DUF4783 domain-containing protein [Bacteroidales bacterium]
MKKRLPFIALLFLLSFLSLGTYMYFDKLVKDEINEAFIKGNAKQLSPFFNDMIDISMENMEATYSRFQAESILNEFFEKNPPASFRVDKEGVSSESSSFVIATYTTAYGCSYRVYYVLKDINRNKKTERLCVLNIAKKQKCQSKK